MTTHKIEWDAIETIEKDRRTDRMLEKSRKRKYARDERQLNGWAKPGRKRGRTYKNGEDYSELNKSSRRRKKDNNMYDNSYGGNYSYTNTDDYNIYTYIKDLLYKKDNGFSKLSMKDIINRMSIAFIIILWMIGIVWLAVMINKFMMFVF